MVVYIEWFGTGKMRRRFIERLGKNEDVRVVVECGFVRVKEGLDFIIEGCPEGVGGQREVGEK